MGGAGKTQIAVEYAYRNQATYGLVWWIRAEKLSTLENDLVSLASCLGLPRIQSANQSRLIDATVHWLEEHDNWLLVFDNAVDPENIRPYLLKLQRGSALITTRNPNWERIAKPLAVPRFSREESVEFICRLTGKTDKTTADALAEDLGDLPLALAQAVGYIRETASSLGDYRQLFQNHRAGLLERKPDLTDYSHTVATTWELALGQLQQPGAIELLYLCACLAPDDIPRSLIVSGTDELPDPLRTIARNTIAFNEVVAALRRYSLIEASEDSLTVHRLVQVVVRDRQEETSSRAWTEAAARLVNRALTSTHGSQSGHSLTRLIPHALAAAEQARKSSVAPDIVGELLTRTGVLLSRNGPRRRTTAIVAAMRSILFPKPGHVFQRIWLAAIVIVAASFAGIAIFRYTPLFRYQPGNDNAGNKSSAISSSPSADNHVVPNREDYDKIVVGSDDYIGKTRRVAKTSFAPGDPRNYKSLDELLDELVPDSAMRQRDPPLTNDPDCGRVAEENRNVRVPAWLYAVRRSRQ